MNLADDTQALRQILDKEVLLHRMTNRIRQSLDLQEILAATAVEVRSFLNADRVMVYRFDPDGSGEVIAESIHENRLPSMLGLHFPADDIPSEARELYRKAGVRSIVDVASQQIGFSHLKRSLAGEPLPAGDIRYRPVSPCHASYLKAMGVLSSLVVPLLHGEELWGLLVAHHSQPQFIFEQDLQVVQQVADQVAIAIAQSTLLSSACEQRSREASINRVAALLHALPTIQLEEALGATVAALSGSGGRLWIQQGGKTRELFACGTQPAQLDETEGKPLEEHPLWQEWLHSLVTAAHPEANVNSSDSLWAIADLYQDPDFRVFAPAFAGTPIRGALVVPLQYRQQVLGTLSIFRDEIDTERLWAGHFDTNVKQLMPRQSFQAWRELKRNQASEWGSEETSLALALGNHFSMAIQQYLLYQEIQALNTNLERQVQERTQQLQQSLHLTRAVKEITDQIRSTLDLQTILQTIVREVRALLNADRVVIYQFNAQGEGEVTVEELRGNWRSVLGVKSPDRCFPDEYYRFDFQGRIQAINHVASDKITPCHREFLQSLQIQANVTVPIVKESELWGLLIAHQCDAPRVWQKAEIEVLQQLASQAAIAIQQAELYAQSKLAAADAKAQAQQLAQAIEELKQMQTQLVQHEKMSSLGQLVAGVAHEINNPVNFIYGNLIHANEYAQALLELVQLYQECYPNPAANIGDKIDEIELDFLVDDLPKMLSSMKVGADRIRQIVLSLRNFSRLDQSEMKPVDIHEGLDSTLMILHHRLKGKSDRPGIQVIREYGKLPLVECYAGQLNQVFMNILANAIDALEERDKQRSLSEIQAEPSKITIRTFLSAESRAGHSCTGDSLFAPPVRSIAIVIADNGSGMPESVRSRIFDPFFTTKEIGKGTGIGLSISRQIVEDKHGGILKCISRAGKGTEFWIEIPIVRLPAPSPVKSDTVL